MSNTGLKGISRNENDSFTGYKVTVGWRGEVLQRYVAGTGQDALLEALDARDEIEKEFEKPRTEKIVRSSGYIPWLDRWWERWMLADG